MVDSLRQLGRLAGGGIRWVSSIFFSVMEVRKSILCEKGIGDLPVLTLTKNRPFGGVSQFRRFYVEVEI